MKWKVLLIGMAVILVGSTASTVFADVTSTSGITVIAPPASVARNQTESDDTIFLFNEQHNFVLDSDLEVDILDPGTYGAPPGGVILAGTCINSYLIHYDLVTGYMISNGSATFGEEVLGLITSNATLDASDWLGAAGTFYPKASLGETGRQTELTGLAVPDVIDLSADRQTVEVTLQVDDRWQDHIRVITQGCGEPEPPPEDCVIITSGMTAIAPPASVARNQIESDDTIFVFCEQKDVVLDSDLNVNIVDPGTYGAPPGGIIPAGTCINSYLIHYDLETGYMIRNGSATFGEEVLGLITSNATLDASDWLGAAGTFYPKASLGEVGRQTELTGLAVPDVIDLSVDRFTVDVTLQVDDRWQDQIRVITQGCGELEPPPTGCEIITSGITVITPPASVARNMTESDDTIFAYCEQKDVVLDSDLNVNIVAPGTYGAPPGGIIPAGTCVTSYLIHYDLETGYMFRNGSATFGEEVLGLITSNATLDSSDWLGPAGTFYPKASLGEVGRQTELTGLAVPDVIALSADRYTVDVTLQVDDNWQDQVRVITQGCGAQEPEVIEVEIDVKPNSDPSCFNSDGTGVIPVAILGRKDFDVKMIDVFTLELDGAPLETHKSSGKPMVAYEDYNHDGYKDLVVKFVDIDNYDPGDEWATLTGNLKDGTPIMGVGDICITQ